MKVKTLAILLAVFSTVLSGCGGGGNANSVEAKKQELMALQTQMQETKKKIMQLEKEIGEMDPNAKKQDPVVQVEVKPVEETTFRHFVSVQGQVESNNNVMVSPKMAGVITRVFVNIGQRVSAGQTLAQIDNSVMMASLTELELQLELATTIYNKQKNLWDQKIGSEIQFLEAKNRKESLEKRIATTKQQIALTRITTPISGTVDRAMVKAGEAAMPGMPAFQVVNLNDLKFTADISEAYVPYVKKGDKVKINFPAINESVDAKIASVSQTINPINRTVGLEVKLPRDPKFKANLTGEISINDITEEGAVVVPLNLLQESGTGNYVLVAEKGDGGKWVAKKQPVTKGMRYEGKISIESGLKKGQMLITQGNRGLEDGQPIKFNGVPSDVPAAGDKSPDKKADKVPGSKTNSPS